MSRAVLPREAIVAEARGWLGTPYRHQASLKGVGCDCLGLLRGVWRALLGPEPEPLPPYRPDWAETGAGEPLLALAQRRLVPRPLSDPPPGAVLVFRWRAGAAAKHCAIATGAGRMIHAHDGASVAEVALIRPWARRLAGVFDLPGVG